MSHSDIGPKLRQLRELAAQRSAERNAKKPAVAELREKVAYLRAGCVNADRDELVQRITAVGSAEWKAGDWLGERINAAVMAERGAVPVAEPPADDG